jgi:hypothetical protein
MSPKNAKKPSRSIRYLLSADRRFERLSLRRMSALVKRASKPPRSGRAIDAARAKNSGRFLWALQPRVIVIGVICVLAAVALIAARQSSDGRDVAGVDPPPTAYAPLDKAAIAARLETRKVVSRTPLLAGVTKPPVANLSTEPTRTVEPERATAVEPAVRASAAESTPKGAAAEPTSKAGVQTPAPVTITGCLELDNETFWLRDTSGAEAPKSRSWRTGFLKKRSSAIELVDTANNLKLRNHVGRRIAATGVLMNGEMRVRSLQRVAVSCG